MGRRKNSVLTATGHDLAALKAAVATKAAAIKAGFARQSPPAAAVTDRDAPIGTTAAAPQRRGPGRPKDSGRGPGRLKGSGRKPGRPIGSGLGPGRPPRAATTSPKRGRPAKKAGTSKPDSLPKDYAALDAALRTALAAAASPVKAGDLAKQVVANGYVTTSKALHLEVGRRLAKMGDVVKPEPGLYALKA